MGKILDIAFSGFWPFVGMCVLIGMPLNFVTSIYGRTLRYLAVKKWGWPPEESRRCGECEEDTHEGGQ